MRVKTLPNCWYGEALPSGEFAFLSLDSRLVLTHFGSFSTPSPGPLYLRVSNVGGFKFAGQGFDPKVTLEYKNGVWSATTPEPYGVSGAIYDAAGVLHVSTGVGVGSQGWRYVASDGRLVTGDETYYSASMGLSEWTDLGDGLFIGQNPFSDPPAVILFDATANRHLLLMECAAEPRFVRAQRAGDGVAVAFVVEKNQPAVAIWTTMQELRALPLFERKTRPYAHPCFVGPYHNTSRRYGNFACPGNFEILSWGYFHDQQIVRPVIAAMDSEFETPDDYLVGIGGGFEGAVVDEQTIAEYNAAWARAQQRRKPLFVYWDDDDYPDWAADRFCGVNRIPIVRGYPMKKKPGEALKATPAEDVSRIRATCTRLRQRFPYVGLARTCYTQSGNYPVQHIEAMQAGLTVIVRDLGLIVDGWFAWGRDPQHALPSLPAIQAAIFPLAASPRPGALWQEAGSTPQPPEERPPAPGGGPEPPLKPPQPILVPTAVLASRTFFRGR